MPILKPYVVNIGGIPHVMQYAPDTAERLGLAEHTPEPAAPAAPARKRRAKADAGAYALLGVEVGDPTPGEATPGDLGA